MSDPEQPSERSKGHRFTKGHEKFGGRQKGSPNKNIREQALAGLARGGANKARKAGVNGKVDGLAYFFEDLAEKNSSAAAALAGKLISSEPPPDTSSGITPGFIVNVVSAAQGTSFSPGNITLLPFDISAVAWKAFNGGDKKWKAYLEANEQLFTAAAFEKLSLLEAPEPKPGTANDDNDQHHNVTPLRLIEAPAIDVAPSFNSPEEERIWNELSALSDEELARRAGVSLDDLEE